MAVIYGRKISETFWQVQLEVNFHPVGEEQDFWDKLWIPKSAVKQKSEDKFEVADWFIRRQMHNSGYLVLAAE